MSQRPSPWRVNDVVLYDALRDETRAAIADFIASADDRDVRVADRIEQLRTALHDVNGFDRDEIAAKLDELRNDTGLSHG